MVTYFRKIAKLRARIKRLKLKYQNIGYNEAAKFYEERIERINKTHESQIGDARKEEEDKQAQRVQDLINQVEGYKLEDLRNRDRTDENMRKENFFREWGLDADRTVKGLEDDLGKIVAKVNNLITPIAGHTLRLIKKESKEIKAIEAKITENE